MSKININHLRTWIEVDRRAVKLNYQSYRRILGRGVKLMAVVKSNAYGHGLVPWSKLTSSLGVDWLGVDSLVEARRLRAVGVTKPILVLGYTRPVLYAEASRLGVTLTISSLESLRALARLRRPPPVHLKVDTGMHRQGFLFEDFQRFLPLLTRLPFQGLYSHLAVSSYRSRSAAVAQIREFKNFLALAAARQSNLIKHLAATGGSLAYPEARFDLVRIGLGLYGLWPSRELETAFVRKIKLRPALVWKTIVSEIKTLSARGRVGYDLTERVGVGTKLAVCPVGYWHGYPRALSGRGRVRIRNHWARVVGRVSMDMIVVEVTKIRNLRVGEEVILLDGRRGPPAEELARLAGTSNYEIITRLNPLIERFYL